MLALYLDDSKDDGDASRKIPKMQAMAGYIGHVDQWDEYELAAKGVYDLFNVEVLHSLQLHKTKGEFRGWSGKKKGYFVGALYGHLKLRALSGFAFALPSDVYNDTKRRDQVNAQISPVGFCYNALIDKVLKHERIGPLARAEGISVFVETGNANNADIQRSHDALSGQYPEYPGIIRQLGFIDKDSCKAVQIADFLAFNFRRSMQRCELGAPKYEPLLDGVVRHLEHYGTVATAFHRAPKKGSRA
ncbi:MAG TPA: hypothetical protein VJ798_07075 [Rhizomicrobium sp.]|nr:hypothetical protein [Rhizomicrobium sp.]